MANYEKYITDPYTGEVALIKANDSYLFNQKMANKYAAWEKRAGRLAKQQTKENGINEALELTAQTQQDIHLLKTILQTTLAKNDRLNWDELKDFEKYKEFVYKKDSPKLSTYYHNIPKKSFLEIFFKSIRIKREKCVIEAEQKYNLDLENYETERVEEFNNYEKKKTEYYDMQSKHNEEVDGIRKEFEACNPKAIEKYIEYVFSKSQYPECISLNYEVFYAEDRRTLIVNVDLPSPDSIPNAVEYKYVATRNEILKKEMKKGDFQQLYDEIISQISIRTIHEVFESLYIDVIDFVVFNGFVDSVDKKTGKEFRACIVSIQAEKEYFNSLNLKLVSPKDCIAGLKGVIASEFINLAPVKPILNLDRNDRRIIESDEVIDGIDPSNNLAEMDWKKFEVLVRDLFSKEFSGEGVDVKVTQASRDAGVDAIIFDPDPIKGGKYIIQAKRYNNVVGVSAVRDLYGTMMNEGAVKGILVTTSTFGKDSIEFAKDKPLALISGAELIHMFNKHGYDVTIVTRKK